MIVSIEEASLRLEELCDAAFTGEEILISREGTAVARLVPGELVVKAEVSEL